MKSTNLVYERKDNALLLRFTNSETLNSLSIDVLNDFSVALTEISEEVRDDNTIRCLILTGEGRAFIAGADIRQMSTMGPVEAAAFSGMGKSVLRKLERLEIPVIAAVNGFALGGGLELMLACDFAYASKKAKLGLPEATLGIIPGFGGSKRLVDRIGIAAAKELVYTGRMIDAAEAVRLRLINRICEPAALLDDVYALASEIGRTSPNSISEVKKLLNLCVEGEGETLSALETDKFGLVFAHPDASEGQLAFIEKREVRWGTK